MNGPIVVGLTGGIGSGKSTFASLFDISNYPVFYADKEAKDLYSNDTKVKEEVIQLLGPLSYRDNEADRGYIAQKVFGRSDLLAHLNDILHPAVRQKFKKWLQRNTHAEIVVREAAILFESNSAADCDFTITISAPIDLRIQRVSDRDGSKAEDVLRRIEHQLTDDQRKELADFEIINDGKTLLIPQFVHVVEEIKSRSGGLGRKN